MYVESFSIYGADESLHFDREAQVYLPDLSELRKLILDNPNLPLVIYNQLDDLDPSYVSYEVECYIDELTLCDGIWMNKEHYADIIYADWNDGPIYNKDYEELEGDAREAALNEIVNDELNNAEFVKAIVIYMGQ